MKELHLQDLLNMADALAHDSLCDLWNQKTVHFLVIFTSTDQDFEVIGAGPTLPYKTMEEAAAHAIAGKKPEFFVKCPAAIAGRLQPRLAPSIGRPGAPAAVPTPSVKGRTASPFPTPPLTPKTEVPEATDGMQRVKPEAPASVEPEKLKIETPAAASPSLPAEKIAALDARERAIAQREHELAALSASLKIREAALRDREAAITESEERLLNQSRKPV